MDNQNLNDLRHSCAHLLAAAVCELYPGALRTIGPAIEQGFYYDFDLPEPISDKELKKIDNKMRQIAKSWEHFEKQEVSTDEAREMFKDNPYKLELIEEFAKNNKSITLYKSGDFVDLCRGGHVKNPGETLKHFKLLSVAGAYWRGDEENKMLTRIYGTCFPTKEELEKYLWQLTEAKKRDHKKLGKELDLFTFSDLVGPGLPLWTPKGTLVRSMLDDFIWKLRKERGYAKVTIPHITKKDLYETSGHWDKFKDELFRITSREGHEFAMKPMNCPHHTQIFDSKPRSYKNMPQRYAETTTCYRDEQTGEISGLARTRAFTQDDAHVFCTKDQVQEEFGKIWDIIDIFYGKFEFELKVRVSLHDQDNPSAYLGAPEVWQTAEASILKIAKDRKVEFYEAKGEAAFYGPKIDFMAKDSIGREWQVATIQLDINMPERFDLTFTNEKGEKERVVMIHAAIMGSIERFLSILIEHYAGAFPVWLAPVQVNVIAISDKYLKYAQNAQQQLLNAGVRSVIDESSKTVGYKIRQSTLQKVPYAVIIGEREITDPKRPLVSVRTREGEDLGQMEITELISKLEGSI